jgi:transcriptional regulator with XRE-family HTH domain
LDSFLKAGSKAGAMIVRKLRLKKGWTQSQLAAMAGVTRKRYSVLNMTIDPVLKSAERKLGRKLECSGQ